MKIIYPENEYCIFWFRRDLRFDDNKGLYNALSSGKKVIPLFIFDTDILNHLEREDPRITFIYDTLASLNKELRSAGKEIVIKVGKPFEIIKTIISELKIKALYTNKDHEPYGINRDKSIESLLKSEGIKFHLYLDHLLFEKDDVTTDSNLPYKVFTPYSKRAGEIISSDRLKSYPSKQLIDQFVSIEHSEKLTIESLGFHRSKLEFPAKIIDTEILVNYHLTRDIPALSGTTRIGLHLRFGTQSIRKLAIMALNYNRVFFNELLWREFYANILVHSSWIINSSFKPRYDSIEWRNNEEEFELWKQGKTGYPMVDAGMRQLNETGFMHNRLRMITASFLSKHLLIDWRWGEAWFAQKLLDYELSSNNGGWQWTAGSGCDAAPYFRIFNPIEQQKKFDPQAIYINKWLPDLKTSDYPLPIVDHRIARERCLHTYKRVLI